MKHGFIMGIVFMFIVITGLQMMLTAEFSMDDTNNFGKILSGYNPTTQADEGIVPNDMQTYTNAETGQSEPSFKAKDVARLMLALGKMSFLYAPALFSGNYIWFWYLFCLPIALAFWTSAVLALVRGVGSG